MCAIVSVKYVTKYRLEIPYLEVVSPSSILCSSDRVSIVCNVRNFTFIKTLNPTECQRITVVYLKFKCKMNNVITILLSEHLTVANV